MRSAKKFKISLFESLFPVSFDNNLELRNSSIHRLFILICLFEKHLGLFHTINTSLKYCFLFEFLLMSPETFLILFLPLCLFYNDLGFCSSWFESLYNQWFILLNFFTFLCLFYDPFLSNLSELLRQFFNFDVIFKSFIQLKPGITFVSLRQL